MKVNINRETSRLWSAIFVSHRPFDGIAEKHLKITLQTVQTDLKTLVLRKNILTFKNNV